MQCILYLFVAADITWFLTFAFELNWREGPRDVWINILKKVKIGKLNRYRRLCPVTMIEVCIRENNKAMYNGNWTQPLADMLCPNTSRTQESQT